jgi:uncharacterized protein YecT (DUF1311 family)
MRAKFLIPLILLSTPPPLMAQRSADSERVCYTPSSSHVAERKCLEKRAKDSEARLESEELAVRSALLRAAEDENERATAIQAFDKSVTEYRNYRSQQCNFVGSLAFGGNAQGDRRLLCEIDLNEERIRQLQIDLKAVL